MKRPTCPGASFALLLALAPAAAQAAKVTADILPPLRRQAIVDTAERLAHRKAPEAVPADLPSPFNPVDFDKPDASELAAAAARSAATASGPAPRPGSPGGTGGPATAATPGPVQPPAPAGDRETLESLAAQIAPSGMFNVGGKPLLVIGGRRFEVGTRFTAAFNGQDYDLELVAIDRTTFTLRYRGEEITRPIKPVR